MSSWRAYHVHTTDLDRLILDCIQPFLERHGERLERCYWERHSAGGPHLRLRLRAPDEVLGELDDALRRTAGDYLASHPSPDLASYSAERARELLEREGASYSEDELRYRNNTVVERSYPPAKSPYASEHAAAFMEDFHHDATPLATAVLADPRSRLQIALRLFFLHPMLISGDLAKGSVSWKSHWEGFAATVSSPELVRHIRAAYDESRDTVFAQLHEVEQLFNSGELAADPILVGWAELVASYRLRARRELGAGHRFTSQPSSAEEAGRMREAMHSRLLRDSAFVRTFWSDDRFLTSLQHDLAFQVPRLMVNLFYNMVARIGLSPLDKMVLCHHAQRAVEEHCACDLTDLLAQNMASIVERQSGRRSPAS